METHDLPAGFEALQPFVARWALATEAERYRERVNSSMEDLKTFYDAVLPLAEPAIQLLNQYPVNTKDLPAEVRNLYLMMMSAMEVSRPIEIWRRPDVHSANYHPDRLVIEN
jgi:triphosphoribosyl-dephospho-CoA synthetase